MLSLFLRLTKEKLIFFSFSLITPPTHPPAGSRDSCSSTRSPDFHPLPFTRCKLRDSGFEGAGDGSGPQSTAAGGPRITQAALTTAASSFRSWVFMRRSEAKLFPRVHASSSRNSASDSIENDRRDLSPVGSPGFPSTLYHS